MTAVFEDNPIDDPVDDTPPTYWSRLLGYVRLLIELFRQRQQDGQDTPEGGAR